MTKLEKISVLKLVKQLMVNHQHYEISAYLRDIERSLLDIYNKTRLTEFIPSVTHLYCSLDEVTYSQCIYILDVVDEWISGHPRFDAREYYKDELILIKETFKSQLRLGKIMTILE